MNFVLSCRASAHVKQLANHRTDVRKVLRERTSCKIIKLFECNSDRAHLTTNMCFLHAPRYIFIREMAASKIRINKRRIYAQ
jgi:hypothetical protein